MIRFRKPCLGSFETESYLCKQMRAKEVQQHYSYLKRRSRGAYFTSLLSISLVLFFLGLFATLALFGQSIARHAQESIAMKIFLFDEIEDVDRLAFQEELEQSVFVAQVTFVSKEEAGKILMENTGEDVLELTDGINPLPASFNVRLQADYILADSLSSIRNQWAENPIVAEVEYPIELIVAANRNVQVITFILALTGVLLVFIALYLIMGTIRLSIYAQRLTIRSMQLIGATNAFIRRPFLARGLSQGALGGLIACGLLIITFLLVRLRLAWMEFGESLSSMGEFIGILGGIVLFGTVLGLIGSYVAVNRFLHRNLDELM